MADQRIDGLNPNAGDSLSQTGTMRTVSPRIAGKERSAAGNSLPPAGSSSPSDPQSLVRQLEAASASVGRDLRFIVDLDSPTPIIRVLDSDTGEVIREIPAEAVSRDPISGGIDAVHLLDTLA